MNGKVVTFQGEHGAYSEQAIRKLLRESPVTIPCRSFQEMLNLVQDEKADYAILPVENSLAGTVIPAYDALVASDLLVQAEVMLRIEHCLMAPKGKTICDIKYVISHHQALAQCSEHLEKEGLMAREYYDTAGAAKDLAVCEMESTAAIASELAAKTYGLDILRRNFEDLDTNTTRFFLMGRKSVPCIGKCKTSIVFTTEHKPGALFSVLRELSDRNLNLTKIESRPFKREMWHYIFFVDFEGTVADKQVKEGIKAISDRCSYFKFVGSYRSANHEM
ncbi:MULTISPECIES: prephenate dehydratase [unclassified Mesotoga]|uniref:prephenate dehydratase n=1 Tax=unclassified Mesotoga TaxID=1184398 RepID=UPI0025E073EF|nr:MULTISPECIES: prephenate dehydratase [unclassified Mesotoga]